MKDFFNATELAKAHGKSVDAWLHRPATQGYFDAMPKVRGATLIVFEGLHQDTLVHNDMAVEFMRWVSPDFAVCVDQGLFSEALDMAQGAGICLNLERLHLTSNEQVMLSQAEPS